MKALSIFRSSFMVFCAGYLYQDLEFIEGESEKITVSHRIDVVDFSDS